MHPFLFQFGSYSLRSYVFCIALGCAVAIFLFRRLNRRFAAERPDDFWLLINVICASGFLGARGLFLLAYGLPSAVRLGWGQLLFSNREGLSTFGAIFGVIFGAGVFCRLRHLPTLAILDRVALILPLVHAIARVGCLLNGCCFGRPVGRPVFWALRFTDSRSGVPPFLLNVPLYPTQLFEIAGDLAIAALLWRLWRRRKPNPGAPGSLLAWYIICYGGLRFLLDPYRADFHIRPALALSLDQALGAGSALAALGLLLVGLLLRSRPVLPST
jgi:phosphatidylglycerol:prolipoprotein diacylglycerol transferase